MNILVVNDDGINAPGIKKLASAAKNLGKVWIVAPDKQCSAMSHRITILSELVVKKVDFPLEEVTAYSVSGTPADCIKVAMQHILPVVPDLVLSGINNGYNAGVDLLYSGTIGAAMEALTKKIPAIAVSCEKESDYEVVDHYLLPILKDLLEQKIGKNEIWNINFPGCSIDECKGILNDRIPAQSQYYHDSYIKKLEEGDTMIITTRGIPTLTNEIGTDLEALQEKYISIGKVKNMVLRD